MKELNIHVTCALKVFHNKATSKDISGEFIKDYFSCTCCYFEINSPQKIILEVQNRNSDALKTEL